MPPFAAVTLYMPLPMLLIFIYADTRFADAMMPCRYAIAADALFSFRRCHFA